MINIVLVEDNRDLAELEENCIKKSWCLAEDMKLTVYNSAEEFVREGYEEFDILVLDIELPGMNGIELAEHLKNRDNKFFIIFLTAHDRYALKSYQLGAAQYILKTEMERRLPKVLQETGERIIAMRVRYKVINCDGEMIKVSSDDILYISKDEKYVHYVTRKGNYRERTNLESAIDKMGGFPFVRVERGFVINARHMVRMSADKVRMDNGEELPVSRRMLPKVKRIINRRSSELRWK